MLKAKASGKGGGGKKSRTGGGVEVIRREKKLETDTSKLTILRKALFNYDGSPRNVFYPFARAFSKFQLVPSKFIKTENGIVDELEISFKACKDLSSQEKRTIFQMSKAHFEEIYNASGYKWSDSEKRDTLFDKINRYLLVHCKDDPDGPGKLVAFCCFNFSLQGAICDTTEGEPCVFVELHVIKTYRRIGLGKRLLQIMELIGRTNRICFLITKVVNGSEDAACFLENMDWIMDNSVHGVGPVEVEESFNYYQKKLFKANPTSKTPVNVVKQLKSLSINPKANEIISDKENAQSNNIEKPIGDIIQTLRKEYCNKHGKEPGDEILQQWENTLATSDLRILDN